MALKSLEVGGVEPPSSSAHRTRLQVCPSFWLSKPGARGGTLPQFVFRFVFPPAPRTARKVSPGQLQTFPTLRAAHRGVRRSTLLTRRERDCRCCWQVKVLPNVRRSASPPATHDTDRTSRNRCTPYRKVNSTHSVALPSTSHAWHHYSAGTAASMMPPPSTRPSSE